MISYQKKKKQTKPNSETNWKLYVYVLISFIYSKAISEHEGIRLYCLRYDLAIT